MIHRGYILSIVLIVLFATFLGMVFTNRFCNKYDWFPIDLCYKSSEGEACGKSQERAIRFSHSMTGSY
jgi:hypothetical protein